MTAEVPTSSGSESSRSSSTRTIVIVVLAVIVLAGAAFVVYKLTYKSDTGEPPRVIAINVQKAVVTGNQATIDKYTTAAGRAELGALKGKLGGFAFGSCAFVPGAGKTEVCVMNRPGGQLSFTVTLTNGKYLVTAAKVGPAGLGVVSCQVGDSAGGWAADGGVVSVMVVAVEEAVKSASATGF